MPLITLDGACLAFGHVALLDKAAFQLDPGERVALIGRNGSGKSSLLKALAGQATLDDGRLWRQPGARIASVPQEAHFPLARSVFATVPDGLGDVAQLLVDYHAATLAVAEDASESNEESMVSRSDEVVNHDNLNENRVPPASIGQVLRDERIKLNLSIGEVSRRLRLSEQKIVAIEEDDFGKLPSGTFLRGFIRNHANFLQLDFNSFIPLLSQSTGSIVQQNSNKQPKIIPLESKRVGYSSGSVYRLFISAVIVLSIALLGYGIYSYDDWGEYFVVKNRGDTANTQADLVKQENGQTTMELSLPLPNLPSSSWNVVEPFKPTNEKPTTAEPSSLPSSVTSEIKGAAQINMPESSNEGSEKTVEFDVPLK